MSKSVDAGLAIKNKFYDASGYSPMTARILIKLDLLAKQFIRMRAVIGE